MWCAKKNPNTSQADRVEWLDSTRRLSMSCASAEGVYVWIKNGDISTFALLACAQIYSKSAPKQQTARERHHQQQHRTYILSYLWICDFSSVSSPSATLNLILSSLAGFSNTRNLLNFLSYIVPQTLFRIIWLRAYSGDVMEELITVIHHMWEDDGKFVSLSVLRWRGGV